MAAIRLRLNPVTAPYPTTVLSTDLFQPKKIGPVGPVIQIAIIVGLFLALIAKYYIAAKAAGNVGPNSTFHVSLLFVPIYEELIFRGVLLGYFENMTSKLRAIVLVSVLFGIWHIKNIFWYDQSYVIHQVAYTTLIFSPIACLVALKFRSVWPCVILHYMNNLVAG
jgi:membrane protease YdiL (CAAX protease family)